MGIIKAVLEGIFAARVASALLDIGLDVNKFNPSLASALMELERYHRGKNSPYETAMLFLITHMRGLHSSAFLFSRDLPELIDRSGVILEMWVKKGKMKPDFAGTSSAELRSRYAAAQMFGPASSA